MAWVWPARGKSRERSGDAAEASIDRALPALLAAHAFHVLRGARFRVPRRPVEAGDPVFFAAGVPLRTGGHVVGRILTDYEM